VSSKAAVKCITQMQFMLQKINTAINKEILNLLTPWEIRKNNFLGLKKQRRSLLLSNIYSSSKKYAKKINLC